MVHKLRFLVLAACLILTGCAGISRQARSQVTFKGEFIDILNNIERYEGETVMLGGRIIKVENASKECQIVVLQMPLASNGRPENEEESQGRFLIQYEQFKDPAIYMKGKSITVVGRVIGSNRRPIGEYMYVYPKIAPIETKLWEGKDRDGPDLHFGIGVGTWF